MTANVMIDIETLSTEPGATVLTIGVVAFDPLASKHILESMDIRIKQDHQDTPARHISASTLQWWEKQSNQAKESLRGGTLSLPEALQKLSDFIVRARSRDKKMNLNVWANDPDFDSVILQDCFKTTGILCPWQFWESKSMRTMKMLAKDFLNINTKKAYPRNGVYHNAEDDAVYQAEVVTDIMGRLALNMCNLNWNALDGASPVWKSIDGLTLRHVADESGETRGIYTLFAQSDIEGSSPQSFPIHAFVEKAEMATLISAMVARQRSLPFRPPVNVSSY
tara:strand:- start:6906 stop:7745 length:840 start_codon:yes stop_codon:yes gene_type:complete